MIPQDISLAICGHAWHGKSTLLGKVVAESGMATQREVEEAHRLAGEGRDPSLVFAQLVFRSKDVSINQSEAARGVTILPSIVRFEFPEHRITVIDTPGQETYANNRFFGMFQADAAMVVVSCNDGVMPITEQVVRILKGFEIPVHAVIVTKMDTVGYAEEAFDACVEEVRRCFDSYGLEHEDVTFVPTSAYAPTRDIHEPGEGISAFSTITWYEGPTIRDLLRELTFTKVRPSEGPLRVAIHGSEVYDNVPGIGKTATALIETGTLRPDTTLLFEPISTERKRKVTARVRSIQLTKGHVATPGVPIEAGVPRQLVGIAFKSLSEKESLRELFKGRGVIAGTEASPPGVASVMELELTVFHADTRLIPGGNWTLHAHVDRVAITIESILALRPADQTEWTQIQPGDQPSIVAGEWGRVLVKVVTRPVAIETADVLPPLSRFVLRKDKRAIGYGRCVKIVR
ncbi:MAG: hypothetical protein KDD82_03785 [Planctomycetes bacterium]|nr:hypothetical protein [Planctomycetota bacterium]